nr:TBC1 domain family member 15-like isoform X2 [Pogona vitticeps]
MKAVEASGLAYQLLQSWLQAIRETITLLWQFAEHQAQWLLQEVSKSHLLKTLCPCLGFLIRTKAQLTTNHNTDEGRTADGSRNNSTRHEENHATCSCSGREREKDTPLPSQSIYSLFDSDGRMDVFRMRKLVYERGTHPSERKITWKFLFGVYPERSTTEERKELDRQMASQYKWMKHSWKQRFPWAACLTVHSDLELSLAIQRYDEEQKEAEAAKPPTEIHNERLPAQFINERQFQRALKDIDADIPRTDRHRTFFQREGLVKLLYLRDILVTYVAFHQDIGYCHGMNDFASRFLETLDNETEAFWCFVGYMRRSAWSFTTMGVRRKTQICEEVLRHVDPELYSHIESVSKEKLIFCLSLHLM